MTRLWAGGIWIKRIPSYIKDNPAKILGLPKTESRTARVSCISRCLPRSSIWDAACGLSLGFRISGLGFRINQAKKVLGVFAHCAASELGRSGRFGKFQQVLGCITRVDVPDPKAHEDTPLEARQFQLSVAPAIGFVIGAWIGLAVSPGSCWLQL